MNLESSNPLEGSSVEGAEAVIKGVLPGVVQVRRGRSVRRGSRGSCAGFLWSPDGSVMTNHHVVAGFGRKDEVALPAECSFDSEVVGNSRMLDLAMLRL